MAAIPVTGGAGDIGPRACKALREAGHPPGTGGGLVTLWRQAVRFGLPGEGDPGDRDRLDDVLARHRPEAAMHVAALSDVGEAGREPGRRGRNTGAGPLPLLGAMVAAGILRPVVSSAGAIHGGQDGVLLTAQNPQAPLDAGGAPKRAVETMRPDLGQAQGLRPVSFRDVNVAGACPAGEIGGFHDPGTHLVPVTAGPCRAGDATRPVPGGVRARDLPGRAPKRSDLGTTTADAVTSHRRNGCGA